MVHWWRDLEDKTKRELQMGAGKNQWGSGRNDHDGTHEPLGMYPQLVQTQPNSRHHIEQMAPSRTLGNPKADYAIALEKCFRDNALKGSCTNEPCHTNYQRLIWLAGQKLPPNSAKTLRELRCSAMHSLVFEKNWLSQPLALSFCVFVLSYPSSVSINFWSVERSKNLLHRDLDPRPLFIPLIDAKQTVVCCEACFGTQGDLSRSAQEKNKISHYLFGRRFRDPDVGILSQLFCV